MLADFLALEGQIIDRLTAEVPDFRQVYSAGELAAIEERSQVVPAAHVIYQGHRVGSGDGRQTPEGDRELITQTWYVVVAVRNARATAQAKAVRAEAGPLIRQTLTALRGWRPTQPFSPLRQITPPAPANSEAGFGYFPLAFTTQFIDP